MSVPEEVLQPGDYCLCTLIILKENHPLKWCEKAPWTIRTGSPCLVHSSTVTHCVILLVCGEEVGVRTGSPRALGPPRLSSRATKSPRATESPGARSQVSDQHRLSDTGSATSAKLQTSVSISVSPNGSAGLPECNHREGRGGWKQKAAINHFPAAT